MLATLCAIPFLASLFAFCDGNEPLAVGYVEGEYVLVAPIETAQIIAVEVRRGDHVAADQPLARLTRRDADIAVAEAKAATALAERQLANLRLGKRPEEIAVIEASLRSAKAQAVDARSPKVRAACKAHCSTCSQAPQHFPKARTPSTARAKRRTSDQRSASNAHSMIRIMLSLSCNIRSGAKR